MDKHFSRLRLPRGCTIPLAEGRHLAKPRVSRGGDCVRAWTQRGASGWPFANALSQPAQGGFCQRVNVLCPAFPRDHSGRCVETRLWGRGRERGDQLGGDCDNAVKKWWCLGPEC